MVAHHAWLARDGHAEHLDVHLLVVVGVHHLAALPGRAQPGRLKEKEQKGSILFVVSFLLYAFMRTRHICTSFVVETSFP